LTKYQAGQCNAT